MGSTLQADTYSSARTRDLLVDGLLFVGGHEHGAIDRVSCNSLDRSGRSSNKRAGWIDEREGCTKVGAPTRPLEAAGSSGESKLAARASPKTMVIGGAEINVVDRV
jgi:hypothetical protein